jgi:hypothetical protein
MVKNNEVCPESDGKTDKKEKTHQIIANPLVSRKAQVTPRSSERIRKVKKKTERGDSRKKEKNQDTKDNQAHPGTKTSRYLYGHNMGSKKGEASQKKGLSPFPEQPCLDRGRVKPKIRTVPGVYGKLVKKISRDQIRRYIQNIRKMDEGG